MRGRSGRCRSGGRLLPGRDVLVPALRLLGQGDAAGRDGLGAGPLGGRLGRMPGEPVGDRPRRGHQVHAPRVRDQERQPEHHQHRDGVGGRAADEAERDARAQQRAQDRQHGRGVEPPLEELLRERRLAGARGHQQRRRDVEEDPLPAREDQDREAHAEHDRVDSGVAAEAGADTGQDAAFGVARQPLVPPGAPCAGVGGVRGGPVVPAVPLLAHGLHRDGRRPRAVSGRSLNRP